MHDNPICHLAGYLDGVCVVSFPDRIFAPARKVAWTRDYVCMQQNVTLHKLYTTLYGLQYGNILWLRVCSACMCIVHMWGEKDLWLH